MLLELIEFIEQKDRTKAIERVLRLIIDPTNPVNKNIDELEYFPEDVVVAGRRKFASRRSGMFLVSAAHFPSQPGLILHNTPPRSHNGLHA